MTFSRKLWVTAAARRDIRSVLRYTLRTWGEDQRNKYAERLDSALQELARFPESGRSHDAILPGLPGYLVGEHIIYYRIGRATIVVVRVLHSKMDVSAQFGD